MMERQRRLSPRSSARALLGCQGRWPVSVEQASLCGSMGTARARQVDGQSPAAPSRGCGSSPRSSCTPPPSAKFRGSSGDHRPRQLLHQPDADSPGRAPEAIQRVDGPVILVTNLLTEGRGMGTSPPAVRRMHYRPRRRRRRRQHRAAVARTLARYRAEHNSRSRWGDPGVVPGRQRRVLSGNRPPRPSRLAQAVWAILATRLLTESLKFEG